LGVTHEPTPITRVALAGLGAMGLEVMRRLAAGVPGVALTAVAARDSKKAQAALDSCGCQVPVLSANELPNVSDVVVECASAASLLEIARPVLVAGKKLMVLSVGPLLTCPELIELARLHRGRMLLATGVLLGLESVSAAAESNIRSIHMTTSKPVTGLWGAPYLVENRIDIKGIREPLRVFSGSAREAATGFPSNLNVAVALSLAGIGPDRTRLDIWADPGITRNTHRIVVDSDTARLDMTVESVPSDDPRTGRMTAASVVASLRKINATQQLGLEREVAHK
jgi:aspartate dehydrogenase